MIRIAALDLTDYGPAILRLQREGYAVEAELIGFEELPPLLETLEALVRSTETFLGAFVDDALVAVISWECVDEVCEIGRLVVSPSFARRGLGRALLRAAIEESSAPRIAVQTAAANEPAVALYLAEGFVVTRTFPAEGIPALLLARLEKRRA